eukprot:1160128-Pelagomonas_calceolata.AAC.15
MPQTLSQVDSAKFTDPHTKVNALLQAHFSRTNITGDLSQDQRAVVPEAVRLLQAVVDVVASSGWLSPALVAMEMSQMVVQALAHPDSSGDGPTCPGAQFLYARIIFPESSCVSLSVHETNSCRELSTCDRECDALL